MNDQILKYKLHKLIKKSKGSIYACVLLKYYLLNYNWLKSTIYEIIAVKCLFWAGMLRWESSSWSQGRSLRWKILLRWADS